ncbi:MAG: electron transport complex subunit RsxC [Victivallales bacterium]|nr:electron transport complex subunit RsxC [Victivallales bacterium]
MSTFLQKFFYGGIHPDDRKVSKESAIQEAPLFPTYTVPLSMHIGAPAKPVVKPGETVLKGQLLAEAGGFVSAPIHSPTSGKVGPIASCVGPMGNLIPCFTITSDGNDTAAEPMPALDPKESSPADLKKRVGDAGIVGMGGASFPTLVKLSPNKPVDTLILNGVECEPGLTADHRLMLEDPETILAGATACATILGVKNVYVGIEANKPDAIAKMQSLASKYGVQVCELRVRYPQGAEKQLIYAVTGRKVPTGGLPMDVGCVVSNVGSCAAIGEAVLQGKPLYERVTTVTGRPVVNPSNWRLRVGTTYGQAIALAGGVSEDPAKIISGGPMMGFTVYSLDVPIMKNTSGILLLGPEELHQFEYHPCIRCGRCNDHCPMQLMPATLGTTAENARYDLAEAWNATDCIECGCCSYVCPSHRPLVQFIRRAKADIMTRRRAAAAAAKAAAAPKPEPKPEAPKPADAPKPEAK